MTINIRRRIAIKNASCPQGAIGIFRSTFSSDCCNQSVNFLATISGSPLQEIDLLGNKLRESLLANRRRPCGLVSWAGLQSAATNASRYFLVFYLLFINTILLICQGISMRFEVK